MLCLNVAIHKENFEAYKKRKIIIDNQQKLFKELEKKKDGTPPPYVEEVPPVVSSSSEAKTVSYADWNADLFSWADFEDVTSMPSTSRNTGKAPMVVDDKKQDYDEE